MEDFRVIYYDYARKNRNRISQQKSYDKKQKQVGKDKENAVVPPAGPLETEEDDEEAEEDEQGKEDEQGEEMEKEGDDDSDHFSFDEYFE